MKKIILLFFIAGITFLPRISANNINCAPDDKTVSEKFKDLDKLESYVSSNPGVTFEQMKSGSTDILLAKANIDEKGIAQHLHPGRKGFPSFREKPWLYIGSGVLLIVIITVYLVFGSGGYSSR
jgi:hypothetical protein